MTQEEYERAKRALVEEIERAFEGVERGSGPTLHEAKAIDDYAGRGAKLAGRRKDTETRWQDVAPEGIPLIPGLFAFMNPAGFRYYLPAYLLWYLEDIDNLVGFEPLSLFYTILEMDSANRSNFGLLNAQQARALAHFLQFQVTRAGYYFDIESEGEEFESVEYRQMVREIEVEFLSSGARNALEKYWGQFLPC